MQYIIDINVEEADGFTEVKGTVSADFNGNGTSGDLLAGVRAGSRVPSTFYVGSDPNGLFWFEAFERQ